MARLYCRKTQGLTAGKKARLKRADAKFCDLKIVAKSMAARFSSRRHPRRCMIFRPAGKNYE
jgi:hypothetical protein